MVWEAFADPKQVERSMQQGFKGTLDQLDAYLASVRKESKA
jgi:hypothetical protein